MLDGCPSSALRFRCIACCSGVGSGAAACTGVLGTVAGIISISGSVVCRSGAGAAGCGSGGVSSSSGITGM